MKKEIVISISLVLLTLTSYSQGNLSLSTPMVWNKVKVKDNWTPSTAPNYKEYRTGSALGYGVNLSYSFRPKFIIKDERFSANIGVGYFSQRFNIKRPFNYNSPLFMIFYTDHYTYQCLNGTVGLSYNYVFLKKYIVIGNAMYSILHSFRQTYTPTASNSYIQINKHNVDFGRIAYLNVGISRYLGERCSVGLNLSVPIYTRWRNDKIFDDDPTTFYRPELSLGSSINVTYQLGKKE